MSFLSLIPFIIHMGKNVLFSEGHGESIRGRIFGPFATLHEILKKFHYRFSYSDYTRLNRQILRHYDLLVIYCPTSPFTQREISDIQSFISRGGRLLLIGNPNNPLMSVFPYRITHVITKFIGNFMHIPNITGKVADCLNDISRRFGIFFVSDWIRGGQNYFSPSSKSEYGNPPTRFRIPIISHFESHPIFKKIPHFYYQGCSLELTKEAKPLAYSDPDTRPPKAIVMATAQFGEGYVFATGSPLMFIDYYVPELGIRCPFHAQLALNIFTWLIRKGRYEPSYEKPSINEKVCPYCGYRNSRTQYFCEKCGNAI
ncbi:MAG: Gldg family protein [Candidatus Helarchaeota archaeon]